MTFSFPIKCYDDDDAAAAWENEWMTCSFNSCVEARGYGVFPSPKDDHIYQPFM